MHSGYGQVGARTSAHHLSCCLLSSLPRAAIAQHHSWLKADRKPADDFESFRKEGCQKGQTSLYMISQTFESKSVAKKSNPLESFSGALDCHAKVSQNPCTSRLVVLVEQVMC